MILVLAKLYGPGPCPMVCVVSQAINFHIHVCVQSINFHSHYVAHQPMQACGVLLSLEGYGLCCLTSHKLPHHILMCAFHSHFVAQRRYVGSYCPRKFMVCVYFTHILYIHILYVCTL